MVGLLRPIGTGVHLVTSSAFIMLVLVHSCLLFVALLSQAGDLI